MADEFDRKTKLYTVPGVGLETAVVRIKLADLVLSVYAFNHKLGTLTPVIVVYDDHYTFPAATNALYDAVVIPDNIFIVDENRCLVDLTTYAADFAAGATFKLRAIGG
jgi:hypothetical protein